jgi:aquaporin Z
MIDLKIIIAEFIGTFLLLTAILVTGNPIYITAAFLAAITMAGKFSGGHINPAVTLTMWLNKSIQTSEAALYILPQIAGAVGAFYLWKYVINSRKISGTGPLLKPVVSPVY